MLEASRYYFLLPIFIFLFLLSNGKSLIAGDKCKLTNVYSYNYSEVIEFLKSLHPNDDLVFQRISRNSSGTTLYIQYSLLNRKNNIISIIKNGNKIKEITTPAAIVYFDDNEDIVAWTNNLSKEIHFKYGKIKKMIKIGEYGSGSFCIDPSGKYFAIEVTPGITDIASIENPDQSIFQIKHKINKIFFRKDKIYLFDYDNENYGKKYQHEKIICQIYKKKDSVFEFEDELQIKRPSARPSPFFVVDMEIESEGILVEDVRDNPLSFLTSWYLFDPKTKTTRKIGRKQGQYAFFLKEDILKKK